MDKIIAIFPKIKSIVLGVIIFLFPLFFLPTTQEFYSTNKLYLLGFGALIMILISTIEFLFTKKMVWKKTAFDTVVVLFLITVGLSVLISSPNKIQAILNPNFGLISILSLTILYFYLSKNNQLIRIALNISALFIALLTIIFFLQPFKNSSLPTYLQFLKNSSFTPLGNQLDLAIFLGFFVVKQLNDIIRKDSEKNKKIFNFVLLTIDIVAIAITLFTLLKPTDVNRLTLPPYRTSWYATVEALKNPLSALFGVGIDNFASIFARVKDVTYNQSPLWQIQSFTIARSSILHIFTETGLFGVIAFILILLSVTRNALSNKSNYLLPSIVYLLFILVFFPPSITIFFLIFVVIALINNEQQSSFILDVNQIIPIYLGTIIISFLIIGASGYLLGRAYLAEYRFKKSLDGILIGNDSNVYENMRQAVILNRNIENYRINFSRLNLLIANNNIRSINQQIEAEKQKGNQNPTINEQTRQVVIQAIQAGINEAKAAVALNPQKAVNWENLANIYRNVIGIAQDAENWTVSSYQRAIVLDPQNPLYRLNLGSVYYTYNNFDEAIRFFEQAVALKPDWANAHYNLAWAANNKGNYQLAASEMQNSLVLINPKTNEADFKKASLDLEEFKKKLPKTETEATQSAETKPSQLNLPSPPVATFEPKLKLPQTASPEAR